MPARTPGADERQPPEGSRFASDVLAGNLRGYRVLRGLEQTDVAERLATFGHRWSRQTVSDIERGRRNVTVDELLALCLVLRGSISRLLDPRGPEGRRSARVALADDPNLTLPVEAVQGLVCRHEVETDAVWEGETLRRVEVIDDPSVPEFARPDARTVLRIRPPRRAAHKKHLTEDKGDA
jgi:transcriptional regulator with XRE-family HTH domain